MYVKCYYEDCKENANYPCIATGCCSNFGCGRGVCIKHLSKKIVSFDRYATPPKFCTNCESKVLKGMIINLVVPIVILLLLMIAVIVLAVTLSQQNNAL